MGRGDVWDGDVWDGDADTSNTGTQGTQDVKIIAKVGGKCDISHFPREHVLVKVTHPALLRVPQCLFKVAP